MKNYLFDTDVLLSFLRGKNPELLTCVKNILDSEVTVSLSVISLAELYLGTFKSEDPAKNLALVNKLRDTLELVGLDEKTALLYGQIQAVLERNGQVIGDFDVLIASTAIANDMVLITGNIRHYERVKSLFGQLHYERWQL